MKWRTMEKLTAVVESYFQGGDEITTRSGINLRNITGYSEQIDVVYSNEDDPRSCFSFAEVRHRKPKKIGRPYIQQMLGKINTTKIKDCTVVSTLGFSRDAIAAGKHFNIKLRTLAKLSEDEKYSWLNIDNINIANKDLHLVRASIKTSTGTKITIEYDAALDDLLNYHKPYPRYDRGIYYKDNTTGNLTPANLKNILSHAISTNNDLNDHVDGLIKDERVWYKLKETINFNMSVLYVNENDFTGEKINSNSYSEITNIEYNFIISKSIIALPLDSLYSYKNEITGKAIAEVAYFTTDDKEGLNKFCFVKLLDHDNKGLGAALFR